MKTGFSVWNVKDFGAKGDKKEREDSAIQKAIDACHDAGGGTVYLPPGDYLSGAVSMRSNVALYLEAGATLWASVHKEDYPECGPPTRPALIMGNDLHNIALVGRGKLNGQGFTRERPPFRPFMVYLSSCRNVLIEDVTFEYASAWTVHLFRCYNVNVRGVTILNNMERLNTDGIDPDCCSNVHISDCHIVAGDDCIVLKTTAEYPCENITVTNCTLETTCAALKLGTESLGDFRHCTFSNCVVRNTRVGIAFYMKDGGTMEDVVFSNITIETAPRKGLAAAEYPIFMNIERRHPESKLGMIRNVIVRDLAVDTRGRCFIEGREESPVENLTLENVKISIVGYEDSSRIVKPRGGRASKETVTTKYDKIPAYFMLAHVRGLAVRNVQLDFGSEEPLEKRFAIYGDHLHGFELGGFAGTQTVPNELPAIQLDDCQDVYVRGCRPPEGTGTFLGLSGKRTARIALMCNDLSRAKRVLEKTLNVQDEAVYQEANRMPK